MATQSLTIPELEAAKELAIGEPEAAKRISVSERTMFNMRKDGQIPFFKLRNRIMYSPAALAKWIASK